MAEVGSTFVSVLPSAKGFGSKLDSQIGGDLDSSGKSAGKRFGGALKVGALAVIGGAAVLGGFLKGSLDEAREAQKVGALTNAVIKSTGGVANVTAKDVDRLATSISLKTGVDDEAIAAGQNMLLTFGNVRNELGKGNDIFSQATVAASDMAAAFGGDAVSNSKLLGKALNDPTKGVSALTRVGVSFTEQQKDQIAALQASGNVMGAQKIILGELSKQTAGAAEATATSGDKFKVAFDNLKESIGTALLPLFDRLLNAGSRFVAFLTRDIGPGIAALNGFLAPVIAGVRRFLTSFSEGGAGFAGFTDQLTKTGTAVLAFGRGLLPTLTSIGKTLVAVLGPGLKSIANLVTTQLLPAFRSVLPVLLPVAKFLLNVIGQAVVGAFKGAIQAIKGAINVITGVFRLLKAVVTGQWGAAWDAVKQIVKGALNVVVGAIKVWFNVGILSVFKGGIVRLLGSWRGMWTGIKGVASKAVAGLQSLIKGALSAIGRVFSSGVRVYIGFWKGLFSGLKSATAAGWRVVRGAFTSAFSAIRSGVTTAVRAYASLWRSLFSAIRSVTVAGWRALRSAFSSALSAIKSLVSSALTAIRGAFVRGWEGIKSATSGGIDKVVSLAKTLGSRILSAIGDLGSLLRNAGVSLIQGLIDGITSKISSLTSTLSNVTSLIPKLKGPPKRDAVLLRPAGQLIMGGLIGGIDSKRTDLRAKLGAVTGDLTGVAPSLSLAGATGLATAAGASSGPRSVILRVGDRDMQAWFEESFDGEMVLQ